MTARGCKRPGGSNQVTYAYDDANRLTSVTDWNSNSTSYSYDDAGRMTATTLPSGTGIVSAYTYDNADRLTNIAHVKGGSTTIASVDYTLDDVGNRTQRVNQQGTHTYVYDDLHRLTSVTYLGPSTTTYDFDAFGNRAEMTTGAGTTTYAYDDADRLTEVDPPAASPVAYTWDDNGNLTDRGSDDFTWDYEDRMVSATVNSVTTNFVYRGDGLRDSRAVSGGATTTFTWDIASGLPVVLDDGNQYVYGAGLTSMKQGGNWYYYLADGLGSTMAVVDSSGNSQKSYQYDVYGEVTGGSGALANEFDFAGQQTDGTGLQYLRARYYDPETGTFLSRDPLARLPWWTGQSLAYSYANPATRSDPTGLDSPISVWDCRKLGPVAGRICGEAQQASQTLTELVGDLDDIALSALTGLTGEYLKDFRAGCAADKGLCAVYFTELFVAWYVGQIFALAVGTVGCGGTAGVGCGVLALSAAVHTYLFKVLTAETKQRIVERGQFERRRDKLLENQRHARCVLSGEC